MVSKQVFLCVLLVSLGLPMLSSARTLVQPSNTVGVTELTYEALRSAHCDIEIGKCDAVLNEYTGKIIMRVEHRGELYQVNTGDGLPPLTRYLPNGFYQAGGKFYWVAAGTKVQLKKHNAYRKIVKVAQRKPSAVVPLSDAQLGSMLTSCEYYGEGNALLDAEYQACITTQTAGQSLQTRLAGSVALLVEADGRLVYIHELSKTNNPTFLDEQSSAELFRLIKNESIGVQPKVMRAIYFTSL